MSNSPVTEKTSPSAAALELLLESALKQPGVAEVLEFDEYIRALEGRDLGIPDAAAATVVFTSSGTGLGG